MNEPVFTDVMKGQPRPLAIILYGLEKVGKTVTAGTFPSPVFIAPTLERGTNSLKVLNRSIPVTLVSSADELTRACHYVKDNHKKMGWETVVLDPWTTLGDLIAREVEVAFEGRDKRAMWGVIANELIDITKILQSADMHVVYVCHREEVTTAGGETIVGYRPAVPGRKAIKYMLQNVDLVFYMEKKMVDRDGKAVAVRGLYTHCPPNEPIPWAAGGRFDAELAEGYFAPKWDTIAKRLKGIVR